MLFSEVIVANFAIETDYRSRKDALKAKKLWEKKFYCLTLSSS